MRLLSSALSFAFVRAKAQQEPTTRRSGCIVETPRQLSGQQLRGNGHRLHTSRNSAKTAAKAMSRSRSWSTSRVPFIRNSSSVSTYGRRFSSAGQGKHATLDELKDIVPNALPRLSGVRPIHFYANGPCAIKITIEELNVSIGSDRWSGMVYICIASSEATHVRSHGEGIESVP